MPHTVRWIARLAIFFLLWPCALADSGDSAQPPQKKEWRTGLDNLKSDGIYLLTFPKRGTRKGVITASAVLGGIAVLIMLDDEIREEVQEARNDTLDRWEERIDPFGDPKTTTLAAGLIYATGALADSEQAEETGKALMEALLFTELFKSAGKKLTGRSPPGAESNASDFFGGDGIFPSGHTARAFAFATVLAERHGKVAAWVAYPIATLVGLFRIESDSHWASDVLAGAALGWAVGKAVSRRREERRGRKVILMPGISPDDGAPGVYLRISF